MKGKTEPARLIIKFSISTREEVIVQLAEDKRYIDIRIYLKGERGEYLPTDRCLRVPISLLPELKRMVNILEEVSAVEGLSDEFEDLEDLKKEREVAFAHPSEEEFAKILDFYHVRWEYEPRTFPLRWDKSGHVIESFTPDFYLPDFNMYIELTTMKQSLVTKKNRKVRLLRKLYPELNIKLLYGKDYRRLLQKYGIGEDTKKP